MIVRYFLFKKPQSASVTSKARSHSATTTTTAIAIDTRKASFTGNVNVTIFCNAVLNVLFTHNGKKIKGAARKNGDTDGACKQV